jgi:hypothetical protein
MSVFRQLENGRSRLPPRHEFRQLLFRQEPQPGLTQMCQAGGKRLATFSRAIRRIAATIVATACSCGRRKPTVNATTDTPATIVATATSTSTAHQRRKHKVSRRFGIKMDDVTRWPILRPQLSLLKPNYVRLHWTVKQLALKTRSPRRLRRDSSLAYRLTQNDTIKRTILD